MARYVSAAHNMLKGVIFDMDGVLIDSHPVHRKAWQKFLASVNKRIDDRELDFILDGRRRDEILRYFFGSLPKGVLDEYGHAKDRLYEENFGEVKLIAGIRDFLEDIQKIGLKMGVATSAGRSRTWGTLHRLQLDKKFAVVITGDDVHVGKPDPTIYQMVSRELGVAPRCLAVLEDAPGGVQAASRAGMCCIGVATSRRTQVLRAAGAVHVIPDFVGFSSEKLLELWDRQYRPREARDKDQSQSSTYQN